MDVSQMTLRTFCDWQFYKSIAAHLDIQIILCSQLQLVENATDSSTDLDALIRTWLCSPDECCYSFSTTMPPTPEMVDHLFFGIRAPIFLETKEQI